jgi:ParB family chromosome partitioning protein
MKKKEELCSFSQQNNGAVAETDIRMVPIAELQDFEGHPFKVENDMALFELMQSIEKEGVIVPALARPKAGGGYELIAGHRRKAACKWAGLDEMPVVIRELDDNQAVIAMVDSNLQREHLKPSEKAFAYKMKLEAMKRQGARTDLTSDQVGPKLENPTMITHGLKSDYDEDGNWRVVQDADIGTSGIRSNELLARQVGESANQIKRYIRLTNLIPKLLDMVDEEKIAFTIAVEISYLTEEQQYELYEVMDMEQCTPSLSQANRIKRMSQSGELDMDAMFLILEQEKPNQREQIKLRADAVEKYFPEGYTPKQKTELIEKLLKEWHEKQELDKTQSFGGSRGKAR